MRNLEDAYNLDTATSLVLNNVTVSVNRSKGCQPYNAFAIPGDKIDPTEGVVYRSVGNKRFEHKGHLGNVILVINDCKDLNTADGILTAHVDAYNDYYPGMLLPNRNGYAEDYRYGFQGQEMDDEIKGEGNSLNYKYRMHDPRVGRFFAVDPLSPKYPHYSPYSFSGNKVIQFVELEGLEEGRARHSYLSGFLHADGQISDDDYWTNVNVRAGGTAVPLSVATDVFITKGAATRMLFKQLIVQIGVNLIADGASSIFNDKEFDPVTTVQKSFTGFDIADIGVDKSIKLVLSKYQVGKLQLAIEAVAPSLFDITLKNGVQVVGLSKDSGAIITDIVGNMITTGIDLRLEGSNVPIIKLSSSETAQVASKSLTDNVNEIGSLIEDAIKVVIEVRNAKASKPKDERSLGVKTKDNIPEVSVKK